MPTPLAIVLPVAFNEAIAAADARKVVLPSEYYGDYQGAARSQAFTVSGLAGASQISAALESLNAGLRKGMTFAEWKALAVDQDWALPPSRLDLILRTHAQTAYNAGAWAQIDRVSDRRGFLMYSAINDSRTRPAHRAMDGITRPVGDSFWDDHSPPCGYNCRCGVISLTEEQVTNRGGPTVIIPPEARADPGWGSKPELFNALSLQQLAGQAIDVPPPLQGTIMDWHNLIQDEDLAGRVQAFVPYYDEAAADLEDFLYEHDGLVMEHEAVALRAYTGDMYGPMNDALRSGGSDELNLLGTIASAASGLGKLPAFEGAVYRGISLAQIANAEAFLSAHAVGEIVEYQGFTSGSYEEPFSGDVHYLIHSKAGRVVEDLSLSPGEYEVLFAPNTKFRVIAINIAESPATIELEELDDQTTPVDDNRKFSKKLRARRKHSDQALARAQSEVGVPDPKAVELFKAKHGGLTPIQYAMRKFPSAAMEVEQHFPHLLPPKKK